jgi:hypothetical protein
MKENELEKSLCDKIKKCLDEDIEKLDPPTVRALRGVRSEVLDFFERKRGFQIIPRWITAGGIATSTVLIASVSVFFFSSQKPSSLKNPDDFELLSVKGQPELYQDLDFYRWLADQKDQGSNS